MTKNGKLPTMTRQCGPITLGLEYSDAVLGIKGIAVSYAIHLTGCNRVCLEWVNKDGEVRDIWIDETRLIDSTGKSALRESEVKPGPGNDPTRRGIR